MGTQELEQGPNNTLQENRLWPLNIEEITNYVPFNLCFQAVYQFMAQMEDCKFWACVKMDSHASSQRPNSILQTLHQNNLSLLNRGNAIIIILFFCHLHTPEKSLF